jgi:MoaA/NifB/PqqE/SkfB family radical SAM enzyme
MVLRYSAVFYDALRLTRKLKPLRVWNFLLIYLGLWLSRLTGKVIVFGKPFAISAEVSAVCNLRCPECIVGLGKTRRDRQRMDTKVFEQLLAYRQKHSFYVNLYFQGEPFLNPELPRLISAASGLGYYTSVSTNGHFLDEENCREVVKAGLDRLIVSLDGLDQDTYAFYRRGGNWQKVADGIANLSRVRSELGATSPLLVVQFLVNRRNEGQVHELKAFARSRGADMVELKSMQVYGQAGDSAFLPENKRFNRYKNTKGTSALVKKKGPCYRLWSHAVYTSDGVLVPCCFDKVPAFPMGSKTDEDPWFSPAMNAFRKRVMQRRTEISICSNCIQ